MRLSSDKDPESFDCILQTASRSHAARFQYYHEDPITRSTMLLNGGAREVVALKSHPELRTANELVLFRSLSVSPLEFKKWLDTTILRFSVMRCFFFPSSGTTPSCVEDNSNLTFVAGSKEDLLRKISDAPRPNGATRLMVFPKSLERWLGDSLPEDFELHPVKYKNTLHAVMVRPDLIRCTMRPPEETFFVANDGPRRVPNQCCKAAGKLAEAFLAIGLSNKLSTCADRIIPERGIAIDIGAAPGGWTAQLAASFRKVIAIDPAVLDSDVRNLKNVVHIQKKTQNSEDDIRKALGEEGLADIICCDANVHPMELYPMVEPVLKFLKSGGLAIVTLKFFGRGSVGKALPSEYFSGSDFEKPEVIWLMANTRSERTVVGRKI